jgi:hypothetical protein
MARRRPCCPASAPAAPQVHHGLHVFQATIDSSNEVCVARHLAWRSSEALLAMARAAGVQDAPRCFVEGFVQAERVLLRDGRLP